MTKKDRSRYANHDFPDFAQEFLRRNPAYRLEYSQLAKSAIKDAGPSSGIEMAGRWGLEFPFPA